MYCLQVPQTCLRGLKGMSFLLHCVDCACNMHTHTHTHNCCVCREAELDARIRAFKTSDPAGMGRLSMDQLSAMLQECRWEMCSRHKLMQLYAMVHPPDSDIFLNLMQLHAMVTLLIPIDLFLILMQLHAVVTLLIPIDLFLNLMQLHAMVTLLIPIDFFLIIMQLHAMVTLLIPIDLFLIIMQLHAMVTLLIPIDLFLILLVEGFYSTRCQSGSLSLV